jgi:hypothetical protein
VGGRKKMFFFFGRLFLTADVYDIASKWDASARF